MRRVEVFYWAGTGISTPSRVFEAETASLMDGMLVMTRARRLDGTHTHDRVFVPLHQAVGVTIDDNVEETTA